MPTRRSELALTDAPSDDVELRRLRRLAGILDGGVDPLLGLIVPGVGDVIATLLGGAIVASAVRRRMPIAVIARMLINLAIDALFGAVPVIGDLFDLMFLANRKNLALLTARTVDRRATAGDWMVLSGAIALLVAILVAVAYGTVRLVAYVL